MVCDRCISVVRQELEKMNLFPTYVQLGEVGLKEEPSDEQLHYLGDHLAAKGFELLNDHKAMMVEKVKNIIVEAIHRSDDTNHNINFSALIQQKMNIDYSYLSACFSAIEELTIEQYIIRQRIERAKELLAYDELTLSEISYKLHYSSVQHLSSQFKKITGLTPSKFKELKENLRKPLDRL